LIMHKQRKKKIYITWELQTFLSSVNILSVLNPELRSKGNYFVCDAV
jgi:hypothetical protein